MPKKQDPATRTPNSGARKFSAVSIASENKNVARRLLTSLETNDLWRLLYDWRFWANDFQLPPGADARADWTTWVFVGGRGAGKTRAGAEWVRQLIHQSTAQPIRVALIAETYHDARAVMIEGPSGILSVSPPSERPVFRSSLRRLEWPNGSVGELYSSEDPDGLRGPQFHAAWCDELAKWRHLEETWSMLQFGLRLGEAPRQLVTTTPRPLPLLKRLLADETTVVTRATTFQNRANLADSFFRQVITQFEGSNLGRQELLGEIVEDRADGLFRRADIEKARVRAAPLLSRIVIAVDPPVTSGPKADECGIVVAGLSAEGEAYVLADLTCQGLSPTGWAEKAIEAYYDFDCDRIVAETNQGGELVETLVHQIDPAVPLRRVRATRGKALRAEPVAALYEQGKVHHVGLHAALEDQMVLFGTDGWSGKSPDRLDALVWALSDLMLRRRAARLRASAHFASVAVPSDQ